MRCAICEDRGLVEMGFNRKLKAMHYELCPACYPDIKREHPAHKTVRLGDGNKGENNE